MRNLPNYDDPVVNSLSETGRELTGIQMNDAMTDMFLNNNVTEWEDMVYALDIPDYYLG